MWLHNEEPVEGVDFDKYKGFVYLITNLLSGKKYIGKKLLLHKKTRQVKGKKKRYLAESDWREYWGSNKVLQQDVKTHGEENFKRTILKWCGSKGETNYWEAYYQFINHVLLSDNFYNDYIRVRVSSAHVRNVKEEDR